MAAARDKSDRGVLGTMLDDRIMFMPDAANQRYTLTLRIAFDRLLSTVIPEWKGRLQEMGTSSTGSDHEWIAKFEGFQPVRAAWRRVTARSSRQSASQFP